MPIAILDRHHAIGLWEYQCHRRGQSAPRRLTGAR